jgi:hypothetical protein
VTDLTCPKCRQPIADAAIDAGQCPVCGFSIDGPVVIGTRARTPSAAFMLGCALAGVGLVVGYGLLAGPDSPPVRTAPEVAALNPAEPRPEALIHIAPFPHEPKPRRQDQSEPPPKPPEPKPVEKKPEPVGPPPVPVPPSPVPVPPPPKPADPPKIDPPKIDPPKPRPVPVVMKIDPKIQPKRHFGHPDDIATLPDLNTGDHVVITGKLRVLRIASVNGKAILDASGLVAEEIVITGDLNNDAVVKLNAPGGKVTIGGFVAGSSKLTVAAPGGTVTVLAGSGRLAGGSTIAVTAKRLEVLGKMLGGTKLSATLTTGGSLKLAAMDERATVTYRRAAPTDPPIAVEKGDIRGGAKVIAE